MRLILDNAQSGGPKINIEIGGRIVGHIHVGKGGSWALPDDKLTTIDGSLAFMREGPDDYHVEDGIVLTDLTRIDFASAGPRSITDKDVRHWFTYHPPVGDQVERYKTLREAGMLLALTILDQTPPGADQSAAIRKVREAIMTANAAIACHSPQPQAQKD